MTATQEAPAPIVTMPPTSRLRRQTQPATAERIVLTGFMGSGKSTTGRLLAAELGWEFLDLDDLIAERAAMPVPHIFKEQGEDAFRKLETAALAAALRRHNTVIALGGGAPETLNNRLLLEQTPATVVVFLSAPFRTLQSRCTAQADDPTQAARPNFADVAAAEVRFAARQPIYRRLAHVVVDTTADAPRETVQAVLSLVVRAITP